MIDTVIRVLLIEDDEEDYMITRDILDEVPGRKYELDWAENFDDGIAAIKKDGYQVYLVDYRLGKDDGLELLKNARESNHLKCPFIILTGMEDRELDMEAMRLGAADFLVKNHLTPDLLDRTIRYAIQKAATIKILRDQGDQLETAQKIAKIGSWELDLQLNKATWSKQLFLNLGYDVDSVEPSRESFIQRIMPDHLDAVEEAYLLAQKSHTPYQIEYQVQWPDGTIHDIIENGELVLDEQGEPWKLVGTSQEITELKDARRELEQKNLLIREMNVALEEKVELRTQELSESQQRLRAAQRMARVGHWQADLNGDSFYCSDNLCDLIGIDREERTSIDTFLNFIHPDDRDLMSNYLNQAVATGNTEPIDFKVLTNKGKELWMQTQARGYDSNGKREEKKVFGIVKDITENKLAEQALEVALNKERSLSQTKSKFVSMASHEFRTPLTTIMASVELIEVYLERQSYEKQRKHIKRITSAVQNLTSILNDFLSLEKLESNLVAINLQQLPWTPFVKEVINDIQQMCQPGQEILFQHEGEKLAQIDEHLLRNIIINLLSNAIKYSPEGQEINVVSKLNDKLLIFEIRDNGIGIPKEEQEQMFNRFFRASNVENIKGTGLGLTIVKRYLDLLEGNISFTSVYGEGTTFRVEIPQEVMASFKSIV